MVVVVLVIWSSARRVVALIASMVFDTNGPQSNSASCLSSASPIGVPRTVKFSCQMRRVVARWETRTADLRAAYLTLQCEGSMEAEREQLLCHFYAGADRVGGGVLGKISVRKWHDSGSTI
jgi:hypothetical protein